MLIKNSDQNTMADNSKCDWCHKEKGTSYKRGYAYIAQGATGRWCEVMWLCDACGAEQEEISPAVDVEAARQKVSAMPGSWADF